MGLFDELKCEYPLPQHQELQNNTFQTKSLINIMDLYKIDENGQLFHELYDIEDRSTVGKWVKEHPNEKIPDSFSLKDFTGIMTKINHRWEKDYHSGEIIFYEYSRNNNITTSAVFSSIFENGVLQNIKCIEYNQYPQ